MHGHTGLGRGQGAREGGKRIKPQDDVDDEAVDVRSRCLKTLSFTRFASLRLRSSGEPWNQNKSRACFTFG